MTQLERPGVSVPDLLHNLGLAANTEVIASGGKIEGFRKGWAVAIMGCNSKVAHWFTRDGFDAADSLCAGLTAPVRWLYGQGNYPRCSHCIRVMSRRIKTGRAL